MTSASDGPESTAGLDNAAAGKVITLDAGRDAPFEIWAFALCLVTWPKEFGDQAFDDRVLHLSLHLLRNRIMRDEQWSASAQLIKPKYFLVKPELTAASVAGTYDRLRRSLQAGHVARPFILEVMDGSVPVLPDGIDGLTVNEMAAYVTERSEPPIDAHNFEGEIFRQRIRPVLHLAAALEAVLTVAARRKGQPVRLEEIAWDEQVVRDFVAVARYFEAITPGIAQFSVDANEQIRLRVVGWMPTDAHAAPVSQPPPTGLRDAGTACGFPSLTQTTASMSAAVERLGGPDSGKRVDGKVSTVRFTHAAPVEVWSRFVCILAWPAMEPHSDEMLLRSRALVAHAHRLQAVADPGWADVVQPIKPTNLDYTSADAYALITNLDKQLASALKVARVAQPFVPQIGTGKLPALPPGTKRPSLMAMCRRVVESDSPSAGKNFRARVFEEFKPVLHLAIAVAEAIELRKRDGHVRSSVADLAWDPVVMKFLIARAQQLEAVVAQTGTFDVDRARQRRIRTVVLLPPPA